MDIRTIFKITNKVSKQEKTPTYVVGGFVRDLLMGKEQEKDIDFVVEGSGLAFAQEFDMALKGAGSLVEFPEFDTARYVLKVESCEEDVVIEFAGARSEQYEQKTRKPTVASASLAADLARRDFTINAMAVPVGSMYKALSLRAPKGRGNLTAHSTKLATKIGGLLRFTRNDIIDLFDGQQDLQNKILRTPLTPDKTFSDDPLRMMRAVRFAGQLEFGLAKETWEAIYRNRERLKIVSAERIQEEFLKMLAVNQPSVCLSLLFQTHLLDLVLPEVAKLDGVEEIYGHQHKNNLVHTFKVVDNVAAHSAQVRLRLAGLLHDIGKSATKKFIPKIGWTFYQHEHVGKKKVYQIGRRLRFSKELTNYLAKIVRWHQQPISLMDEGITDSAVRRLIVNLGEELDDLLILGRSDITTGNPLKKEKRLRNYDRLEKRIAEVLEKDKLRAFQSPMRGDEIMRQCGLKPGPTVGRIKEAIEEAILDGVIPNEYEAAVKYFEEIKNEYLSKAQKWEIL